MKPEKNKEKQFETCRFYIYIYVCVYLVLIIINLSPGPVGNVLSSFYWIMDNISSGYMNKYVGNPSIVLLIQMDFSLLSAFYLETPWYWEVHRALFASEMVTIACLSRAYGSSRARGQQDSKILLP